MFAFVPVAVAYLVPFLLVLTVVVTVHEFGHFLAARLLGVAMDRFAIGFGRPIFSWREKNGMEWRIGWLPLGGYVRFSGDDNAASVPDAEDLAELRREVTAREGASALQRYFHFKPLWQRAVVVAAGPFANFVLAVAIFAGMAMAAGEVTMVKPRVAEVIPASPAAQAGFQPGDLIVKANGRGIDDFTDLQRYVVIRAGEPIRFTVERGAQTLHLVATPARRASDDPITGATSRMGYLGIGASRAPADLRTFRFGPIAALGQGVRQTTEIIGSTLTYLRRVVTGRESGDQLLGPLGIAGASGDVAMAAAKGAPDAGAGLARSAIALVGMAGFISVAIGFANLLPIPVLDGGHLLFYAYEAVARRPLSANVQAAGYRFGFALLIGLMLFVTWNDLQRYRVFQFIGGLFS